MSSAGLAEMVLIVTDVERSTRFDQMRASAHYFFDPGGNHLEFWSPEPRTRETIHES